MILTEAQRRRAYLKAAASGSAGLYLPYGIAMRQMYPTVPFGSDEDRELDFITGRNAWHELRMDRERRAEYAPAHLTPEQSATALCFAALLTKEALVP